MKFMEEERDKGDITHENKIGMRCVKSYTLMNPNRENVHQHNTYPVSILSQKLLVVHSKLNLTKRWSVHNSLIYLVPQSSNTSISPKIAALILMAMVREMRSSFQKLDKIECLGRARWLIKGMRKKVESKGSLWCCPTLVDNCWILNCVLLFLTLLRKISDFATKYNHYQNHLLYSSKCF